MALGIHSIASTLKAMEVSGGTAAPFRFSLEDPLPLQEYYDAIDAHWNARVDLKAANEHMALCAAQSRAIQKRLLGRLKDRNPPPLAGLDHLMESAHAEAIAACNRVQAAQEALRTVTPRWPLRSADTAAGWVRTELRNSGISATSRLQVRAGGPRACRARGAPACTRARQLAAGMGGEHHSIIDTASQDRAGGGRQPLRQHLGFYRGGLCTARAEGTSL